MPPASAVLPWPDPFPDFVGYQFFQETGGTWGHGFTTYRMEILGSTVKLPPPSDEGKEGGLRPMSLHVKNTLTQVPDDACDNVKSMVGNFILEGKSGRVDMKAKAFHMTAAEEVENTIEGIVCDENFQGTLSADNLVLQCITSGRANGFMIQSDLDNDMDPDFCPDLVLRRGDSLQDRLTDAWNFLQGAKLYEKDQARRVLFSLKWQRLSKIDTLATQFDARAFLELRWLLEKEDVYSYLAKPEGWQPNWSPTGLSVMNMASDGSASIRKDAVRPKKVESDAGVYAVQVVEISGSFFEDFELESFPTDVQPLNINLQLDGPPSMEFDCFGLTMNPDSIQASEWIPFAAKTHSHTKSDSDSILDSNSSGGGSGSSVRHQLTVTAYVRRKSFVFVVRIVVIMGLLAALSLSVFAMKPLEDFGDQLSNLFTLLLTAIAYSLVVASSLPILGYLTFLDKYILVALVYICMVVVQVVALRYIPHEDPEELDEWNTKFLMADALLLVCGGLLFGAAYFCMKRREHAKVPAESDPKARPNEGPEAGSARELETAGQPLLG